MNKENKDFWNKYLPLIIIVLALIFVLYWFFNSKIEIKDESPNPEKVAGLYNSINVGDLSFTLSKVDLLMWSRTAESYTLYWFLTVKNNGNAIENVSNCGYLLFTDGTQYNFDVNIANDKVTSGECTYSTIIPGATISIYSSFYFNNAPQLPYDWIVNGVRAFPDSPEIIYMSQQSQGLVKFEVSKGQISRSYT